VNKEFVVLKSTQRTCRRSFKSLSDDDHEDKIVLDEKILIEKWLDGKFEKWNSNSGHADDHSLSVQALCHWTYHYSDGKYLFCDAQGVHGDKYCITDPCIVSKIPGTFGVTDGGETMQYKWFYCHKCNKHCGNHWKKPTIAQQSVGNNLLETKKQSTYTWDAETQIKNNANKYTYDNNKLNTIDEGL